MFEGKERIALRLENEHNQIWREEGGLTFFNKNNRVNFPGVKGKMKLSGVYFFFLRIRGKTVTVNSKRAFTKHINDMLFSLLEAEDDYVESPILLPKIHNYRANTEFNLLSIHILIQCRS